MRTNSINHNGVSICPIGEERYSYLNLHPSKRLRNRYCQYDYRHTNGQLFSCVAPSLDRYREKRDTWLNNRAK